MLHFYGFHVSLLSGCSNSCSSGGMMQVLKPLSLASLLSCSALRRIIPAFSINSLPNFSISVAFDSSSQIACCKQSSKKFSALSVIGVIMVACLLLIPYPVHELPLQSDHLQ